MNFWTKNEYFEQCGEVIFYFFLKALTKVELKKPLAKI